MSLIEYSVSNHIGWIKLNRPAALNTMNAEFLETAVAVFNQAVTDESTRVIVLTGNGRAFCAGGDLSCGPGGSVSGTGTPAEQADRLHRFMQTSAMLYNSPKVTIAAINGACAGAGLSWAAACNLRYASEQARFNTAFLSAGLSGDFGGTWLLPRIVGAGVAAEKYLLSTPFDAQEAARIGFVNAVVAPAALLTTVTEVANQLVAQAPLALRAIAENLRDHQSSDFATALRLEAQRHSACARTADALEATNAFLEKRQPIFKGC